VAIANGGARARQGLQRLGRSEGKSLSSAGAPHSGQPEGSGKSVSAQTLQNGESPATSQAAQRGGNNISKRKWSEMDTQPRQCIRRASGSPTASSLPPAALTRQSGEGSFRQGSAQALTRTKLSPYPVHAKVSFNRTAA
jgi:hypothetical protein